MVFNMNRQNSAYLRATKYLNYLLRTMCIITRIPCKYLYITVYLHSFIYIPVGMYLFR